ncbi:MAG: SGNH/GDSL hydrolase family protein [Verrucomicrobia bacterium]|nr:SGNH/GDSL hydrolase family protein [Verrucomicrobiota bacterium]
MPQTLSSSPPPSRWKLWIFRSMALVLALAAGAAGGEWFLRQRQRQISASDRLDPGLVRYDPMLGWRLQSDWKGNHRHADFSAQYSIDAHGFRRIVSPLPSAPPPRVTAVLGDSFTFGFGVNDDQTFVHLLDAAKSGGMRFRNFAVPGYSTDQQALLLEQGVLPLRPARVLLVVYLGNDLLDNLRPIPLQVRLPKPHFDTGPSGLTLRNSPVPLQPPSGTPSDSLTAAILGADPSGWPLRLRFEQRCEIFRLVSQAWGELRIPAEPLSRRLAPAAALCDLILARMQHECERAGVDLRVVLLAGKSHAEQPGSLSAQYQEYFRSAVNRAATARRIATIDLASPLRTAAATGERFFFPNDGHLNPAGHARVAEILREKLAR